MYIHVPIKYMYHVQNTAVRTLADVTDPGLYMYVWSFQVFPLAYSYGTANYENLNF